MSIKNTKFSQQKHAFERALRSMKNILQIENLPEEIMTELKKSYDFLTNYDINIHDTQKKEKLKGKVLTGKDVQKMVVEATGYTKWTVEELGEDDMQDESHLKDTYGVDFDESKQYHVSRSSNNRDDLWLVTFVCMPGHVYISLDTDRAGWFIKGILKNKDAKDSLIKDIEKNL